MPEVLNFPLDLSAECSAIREKVGADFALIITSSNHRVAVGMHIGQKSVTAEQMSYVLCTAIKQILDWAEQNG